MTYCIRTCNTKLTSSLLFHSAPEETKKGSKTRLAKRKKAETKAEEEESLVRAAWFVRSDRGVSYTCASPCSPNSSVPWLFFLHHRSFPRCS